MKKNRVLIVDDNNQLRNVLSVFLSQKGFSTETAENGVEGLTKFTSHPFDVVLTDIQMPYIDGLSLSNEIRKKQSKTTIIIMTGDVQLSQQARSVADFVLLKPFSLKDLNEKLQCCVRGQVQKMNNQIESRNSNRNIHETLITLKDDYRYPFYGMIYNANQSGLYFKALHQLQPGNRLQITIEDLPPGLTQNSHQAAVVWCEKLNDNSDFRYGSGIKYC